MATNKQNKIKIKRIKKIRKPLKNREQGTQQKSIKISKNCE